MKKLFLFLALVGILFSSNCTRMAKNNDPIIGISTDTPQELGSNTHKSNPVTT